MAVEARISSDGTKVEIVDASDDSVIYAFPASDGTNNQYLATDGAGTLSFQDNVPTQNPSFLVFGDQPSYTGQTSATEAKTTNGAQNGQGWRLPLGGTVTHISAQFDCGTASGNFEAELYKNGSATGKKVTITLSSTGDVGGHTAITAESFNAGDRLGLFWKHTSGSAVTSAHAFTIRILAAAS